MRGSEEKVREVGFRGESPNKNQYHLRLDGFQAGGSNLKKLQLFQLGKYHKSSHQVKRMPQNTCKDT